MLPSTLQGYVRAQPFRPFRVVMNSGDSYDVRHPEMIRLGRDFFNYYSVASTDQFPETWETVSLLLVDKVQFIDATAAKGKGDTSVQ